MCDNMDDIMSSEIHQRNTTWFHWCMESKIRLQRGEANIVAGSLGKMPELLVKVHQISGRKKKWRKSVAHHNNKLHNIVFLKIAKRVHAKKINVQGNSYTKLPDLAMAPCTHISKHRPITISNLYLSTRINSEKEARCAGLSQGPACWPGSFKAIQCGSSESHKAGSVVLETCWPS